MLAGRCIVGAPTAPSGSRQASIDARVVIAGEEPPYGTMPGG